MSLPTDSGPRSALPPAANPPWPIQPPPHGAAYMLPVRPREKRHASSSLTGALAAAALAAAAGLAVAIPLLIARRARSAAPNRTRRRAKA